MDLDDIEALIAIGVELGGARPVKLRLIDRARSTMIGIQQPARMMSPRPTAGKPTCVTLTSTRPRAGRGEPPPRSKAAEGEGDREANVRRKANGGSDSSSADRVGRQAEAQHAVVMGRAGSGLPGPFRPRAGRRFRRASNDNRPQSPHCIHHWLDNERHNVSSFGRPPAPKLNGLPHT